MTGLKPTRIYNLKTGTFVKIRKIVLYLYFVTRSCISIIYFSLSNCLDPLATIQRNIDFFEDGLKFQVSFYSSYRWEFRSYLAKKNYYTGWIQCEVLATLPLKFKDFLDNNRKSEMTGRRNYSSLQPTTCDIVGPTTEGKTSSQKFESHLCITQIYSDFWLLSQKLFDLRRKDWQCSQHHDLNHTCVLRKFTFKMMYSVILNQ